MPQLSKTSLPGSSGVKALLIPVLAVILGVQLWPAKPSSDTSDETTTVVRPDSADGGSAAAPASTRTEPRALPPFDLSQALAHDPFQTPAALAPEAPKLEEEPAPLAVAPAPSQSPGKSTVLSLKNQRVSAILISERGAAAVVDSKICRVNDWLSPGVRVVEIRQDGVVLRLEPPDAAPTPPPAH